MAKRRKAKKWIIAWVLLGVLAIVLICFLNGLRPVSSNSKSRKTYIRYEKSLRLSTALIEFEKQGYVRSSLAARILALIERRPTVVPAGSYAVSPGMDAEQILRQLRNPVTLLLRLPETNWANRTAHLLANYDVVSADEYMKLVHDPSAFSKDVSFPLPKDSLEGYLYPKKYDLPPLYGARRVILEQLKEFEKSVWNGPDRPKDLKRTLIVASLVQLESGKDYDRPMIAGVIENRLKQKMPLQIDATILYALQKWRRLNFKDYHGVQSPYNTYTVKGLPPGPICSPDAKDIEAALHPAKHKYLYYVALPDGRSIYAATYKEHLKNIAIRKAAIKGLKS